MKQCTFPAGRAFSMLEALIVCAVIAVVAGVSVPMYRLYLIRSDLHRAAEQAEQSLRRAQLLSQTGARDGKWGYRPDVGIIFSGDTYQSRNTSLDEQIAVPETIAVSGLSEVVFSRLYGVPNAVGDIVFTATNGDRRIVTVTADTALAGPPVPPVRFKVHFDRIKNSGHGSAEKRVFVGGSATEYAEDAWIPVSNNGSPVIDDGIDLEVPGLSVQRENGFVRIVAFAGLEDNGGKEVIDATITFDRGIIDHIANEPGVNEGEQPFDGGINDGVGGDEYILAPNKLSVQFMTRSTNAGDTILIFWQ